MPIKNYSSRESTSCKLKRLDAIESNRRKSDKIGKIESKNLESCIRTKKLLESMENAEIKFLQPDFLINKSIYQEELVYPELQYPFTEEFLSPSVLIQAISPFSNTTFSLGDSDGSSFASSDDSNVSSSVLSKVVHNLVVNIVNDDINSMNSESSGINSDMRNIFNTDSTNDSDTESVDLVKCQCGKSAAPTILCISCKCFACFICALKTHQDCETKIYKDSAIQFIKQIEIKMNVLDMVMLQIQEQLNSFKNKFHDISQALNQLTDFLIDIIKNKLNEAKEELELKLETGLSYLDLQYSTCEKTKSVLACYSEILMSKIIDTDSSSLHDVDMRTIKCLKNNTEISNLLPSFELNTLVIRNFLEMQEHRLGYIKIRENDDSPLYWNSVQKSLPSNCNILQECIKNYLPRKLTVFSTNCGTETNFQTDVNSVAILPNNRVLLTSPVDHQVKLFSFQGVCRGELTFPSPPAGICVWKETVPIVTLPHASQIVILRDEPQLDIELITSTDNKYFGLASGKGNYYNYLFAAASFSNCIDVLEFDEIKTFQVLKRISLSTKPWGYACNLCQTSSETIVVADCFGNRLVGVQQNRQILFEISGNDKNHLKCPADVTANDVSMFVSDVGSNRILCFNLDGSSMNVFLTSQDGLLRPKSIDVNDKGYLVVSQFTEWPALITFQILKK
ncbi:uncharacterized protein LOC115216798 [Argonauta hians]